MDDVQGNGGGPEGGGPGESVPQPPPSFIEHGLAYGVWFLSSYGWFLVFGCVAAYFLWNKFRDRATQYMESIQVGQQKKMDAETVERSQLAREERIRKLQEEHDRKSAAAAEKQAELEEKKRLEKIEDWDRHQQGKGYRSKVKKPEEEQGTTVIPKGDKKPRVRDDDYSPLTGGGGACAWRPDRRGPASGRG